MQGLASLFESTGVPPSGGEGWAFEAPPDGWKIVEAGIWLNVNNGRIPAFGWKVHLSATLADAASVLQTASRAAYAFDCSFKFLSGVRCFLLLHSKNASRFQSGKFITLYPPNEHVARGLMDRLNRALSEYRGLDILTDRAYNGSSNVFYRWGAFQSTGRLNDLGEPEELIPNGKGEMVPDFRAANFLLPEGIIDPFSSKPALAAVTSSTGTIDFDQFTVEHVLRFTNAGGRYKAVCQLTGAEVVIKEARPHTGYVGYESAIPRLRNEARILNNLSEVAPRITPALLKEFSVLGHYFIAIEYRQGTPLSEWIARENPLYSCSYSSLDVVDVYFQKVNEILATLRRNLEELHSVGFAYGDLSVGNVVVDDKCVPHLIDFEACTTVDDMVPRAATPDFCLIGQAGKLSARERDWYAYHCIAVSFILRLTSLAEISDHVLDCLTNELGGAGISIPQWWTDACDHLRATTRRHSPNKSLNFKPAPLDTGASREILRDALRRGIIECYAPTKEFQFPVSGQAMKGAYLSFGSGVTGLLPILEGCGQKISADILSHYAGSVEVAIDNVGVLPLGYNYGISGILETCDLFGLPQLSERIIEIISKTWMRCDDPSLATGLVGVSLTLLRRGCLELSEEIMSRAIVISKSYSWKKNGLARGRSGVIAGACQFRHLLGKQPGLSSAVRDLISAEFDQTVRHPNGASLSLRGETNGNRVLPYLSDGAAGFLLSLIMASETVEVDFQLADDVVVSLSGDLGTPFMLEASLMDGVAGLALVLEIVRHKFPTLADRIPDPGWDRVRKYVLPINSGVGLLNPRSLRVDLSYAQGAAGLLAALLWRDNICSLNLSGLHVAPGGYP